MLINISSCEPADLQKPTLAEPLWIMTRGECELCDDDELCCCELILTPMAATAMLRLCGTQNGIGTCSGTPPDPCEDFNDGGQSATLSSGDPKHEFCLTKNTPFSVTNIGSQPASFSIVCWDQLSGQDQEVVGLGVGNTEYFFIYGGCDVEACE